MSNFTYEKYLELVRDIEEVFDDLNVVNELGYISNDVEEAGRKLISIGNSLIMYIRHSKKAKVEDYEDKRKFYRRRM